MSSTNRSSMSLVERAGQIPESQRVHICHYCGNLIKPGQHNIVLGARLYGSKKPRLNGFGFAAHKACEFSYGSQIPDMILQGAIQNPKILSNIYERGSFYGREEPPDNKGFFANLEKSQLILTSQKSIPLRVFSFLYYILFR